MAEQLTLLIKSETVDNYIPVRSWEEATCIFANDAKRIPSTDGRAQALREWFSNTGANKPGKVYWVEGDSWVSYEFAGADEAPDSGNGKPAVADVLIDAFAKFVRSTLN